METAANNTQSSLKQEVETANKVNLVVSRGYAFVRENNDDKEYVEYDDEDENDDDEFLKGYILGLEEERKRSERDAEKFEERGTRMMHMRSLFGTQPELERIAKDWQNKLIDSNLREYLFTHSTRYGRKTNPEDFKYIVNLCGSSLTTINIAKYCSSSIMPLIKSNCSNLKKLLLNLNIIEDQDFENCFFNMPHLEILEIRFENCTVPMTLANSLEQVCETLKTFVIVIEPRQNQLYSPDSSVSEFSPSIKTLMNTIVNMKNIEVLKFHINHGVTDEFLINLINNAKKINRLGLTSTYITDAGIEALNNAKQLKTFDLYTAKRSANKFITDQSLKCLSNKKITMLTLSNCINVTNSGVITLVKNLPSLFYLKFDNSKITNEICEEINKLRKCGETNAMILG